MSDHPTERPQQESPAPAAPEEPTAPAPYVAAPPARRWTMPSGRAAAVGAAAAALVIGGASGFGLGFLVGHHGLRHDRAPMMRFDPDGDRFGGFRDWPGPRPDRPRWAEPEESESPSPSSSAL